MEELDLLKKNWNKTDNFPKITEEKIYAMLHKNSSSAVKWIFIISVIEILLWSTISFIFGDDEYFKLLDSYHIKSTIVILTVLNYSVILYFIYKFYTNYRKIDTSDSVKGLLQNILNTRKTVKHYVWYNLVMMSIIFILLMISQIQYDKNIQKLLASSTENQTMTYVIIIGIYLVILTVLLVVFILFYKLIYGILVKRLKHNYQELERIDY